jgi:thymidylate synthase (FAD)
VKAEYIDHMGDDLRVVNAARVSFDKESPELNNKDTGLIRYLSDHNHWTPFAHCVVTMRETMPIFMARQRFKHIVGFTYNEVSRRYVDGDPEFYNPKFWRKRAENKKQGSSDEEISILYPKMYGDRTVQQSYERLIEHASDLYRDMIEVGVCPEQARMILPQSMMTSYYVTGSLAAWARAYKQRIHDHAQREWDEITPQWDGILRSLFPNAWSSLVDSR